MTHKVKKLVALALGSTDINEAMSALNMARRLQPDGLLAVPVEFATGYDKAGQQRKAPRQKAKKAYAAQQKKAQRKKAEQKKALQQQKAKRAARQFAKWRRAVVRKAEAEKHKFVLILAAVALLFLFGLAYVSVFRAIIARS